MPANQDLSHIDVQYVASLARLELTDGEIQRYSSEIDAVLEYMEQLDELDLEGIEPTAHAVPRQNILRDDLPGPADTLERPLVIDNAPAAVDDQYIKVPPVFDDEGGG